MTNYERIKNMTPDEMKTLIERLIKTPGAEYYDLNSWLKSEDENMIYKGEKGIWKSDDGKISCCIILKKNITICGSPYVRIICDDEIHTVPAKTVKVI